MPVDFERALRALTAADARFVVIGGFALMLHGSSYLTIDLDIAFDRSRDNAKKIVGASAVRSTTARISARTSVHLRCADADEYADMTFRILSIDGLIAAKRTANRPKDQPGLIELEALKEARALLDADAAAAPPSGVLGRLNEA